MEGKSGQNDNILKSLLTNPNASSNPRLEPGASPGPGEPSSLNGTAEYATLKSLLNGTHKEGSAEENKVLKGLLASGTQQAVPGLPQQSNSQNNQRSPSVLKELLEGTSSADNTAANSEDSVLKSLLATGTAISTSHRHSMDQSNKSNSSEGTILSQLLNSKPGASASTGAGSSDVVLKQLLSKSPAVIPHPQLNGSSAATNGDIERCPLCLLDLPNENALSEHLFQKHGELWIFK